MTPLSPHQLVRVTGGVFDPLYVDIAQTVGSLGLATAVGVGVHIKINRTNKPGSMP